MNVITRSGSCLCAAVRFEVTGEPITMTYCHCESCRRWVSAPATGGCLFRSDQIRVVSGKENLTLFKRTVDSESLRKFCSKCGSALFNEHPTEGITDVMAVSIQDLEFMPKLHTHYAEKIVSFRDGLPKYRDFDPEVGGSGETLPD